MRPVNKGNPVAINGVNYPFQTWADLANYNFQFAGRSKGKVTAMSKAYAAKDGDAVTLTADHMVTDLINIVRGGTNNGYVVNGSTLARAVKRMKEKLTDGSTTVLGYSGAKPYLTAMLGEYCSYCEMHCEDSLHVEHKVPKDNFPGRFVLWQNFLLACKRCNSSKGVKPSRADATAWAGGGAPTEDAMMTAAEDHFFWPDLYHNTYRRITYNMKDVAHGYATIRLARRTTVQGGATFANHQVWVTIAATQNAVPARIRVEVTAESDPNYGDPNKTTQTIGQTLLSLTVRGDRRNYYRTRKWFKLFKSIARFEAQVSQNISDNRKRRRFESFWDSFLDLSTEVGFYSSIVWILRSIDYPAYLNNPNNWDSLADKFAHDTLPGNGFDEDQTFPGTDTTEVP